MSQFSDATFAGNNDKGIKGDRKIQKIESKETAETEEPDFLKQQLKIKEQLRKLAEEKKRKEAIERAKAAAAKKKEEEKKFLQIFKNNQKDEILRSQIYTTEFILNDIKYTLKDTDRAIERMDAQALGSTEDV